MAESLTAHRTDLPPAAAVGALVALHLVLAFLVLTPAPHTGGDNAGYLTLARSLLEHGRYLSIWLPGTPPQTQYPPVFPALLAAGLAVGLKPWLGLKLITILFSAAAVAFTYLWLDGRTTRPIALGVTLLVAVVPGVLENSHWILSDVPFWAFTMVALWAFQDGADRGRFAVGVAATMLAYFTRSAGLPLVMAVLTWLLLRRRWRRAAVLVAVFVPLAGLWWLRAHLAGGFPYVQQFLAVDPYSPGLGRIGFADLFHRVVANDGTYIVALLPMLLFGAGGVVPAGVAVLLLLLALLGWGRRVRRPSVAELFLPLYTGLLLVWPQVWAGERFLLPLLPVVLSLAAETWVAVVGLVGRRTTVVAALVGLAVMLVAAAPADYGLAREGRGCMARYRDGHPWACLPAVLQDYMSVAQWARSALPPDAVVISRKPRVFFVVSGLRGEMFPLDRDPATLLALARRIGARYVVLDHLDTVSLFLLETVMRRPDAFCTLRYTRPDRSTLLGITGGSNELPDAVASRGQNVVVKFRHCGPGYLAR
ncbi:MAG: hypothetical protein P8099_04270 [Gemmatimonadota bacterium]